MALRILIGLGAVICFGAAIFGSRGKFYWGEEGDGPIMKQQWLGRVVFGLMGLLLTYAALFVQQ